MSDEEPKKRSAAERVRIKQGIEHMRWALYGLEKSLEMNSPIGSDTAGAVMTMATNVVMQIAKHDAYLLAEEDAAKTPRPSLDFIQEGLEKRPFKKG